MLLGLSVSLFIIAHGLVYLLYFVSNKDKNWPFTFNIGLLLFYTSKHVVKCGTLNLHSIHELFWAKAVSVRMFLFG